MLLNAVSGSFSAWQQHCRFYELIVIYHSEMIQLGEVAAKQSLSRLYSNYPPHASIRSQDREGGTLVPNEIRWARNNSPHNPTHNFSHVATCLPIKFYKKYGYLRD